MELESTEVSGFSIESIFERVCECIYLSTQLFPEVLTIASLCVEEWSRSCMGDFKLPSEAKGSVTLSHPDENIPGLEDSGLTGWRPLCWNRGFSAD